VEKKLTIKVTRLKKEYHARLRLGHSIIDEMSCKKKQDIGWICREMLRWYSKTGGVDPWAEKARDKQIEPKPMGIKYLGKSYPILAE